MRKEKKTQLLMRMRIINTFEPRKSPTYRLWLPLIDVNDQYNECIVCAGCTFTLFAT